MHKLGAVQRPLPEQEFKEPQSGKEQSNPVNPEIQVQEFGPVHAPWGLEQPFRPVQSTFKV